MRTQSETNPTCRTWASLGWWGSQQSVRHDRAGRGHGALTLCVLDVTSLLSFGFGPAVTVRTYLLCVCSLTLPAETPANSGLPGLHGLSNLPVCIPAHAQSPPPQSPSPRQTKAILFCMVCTRQGDRYASSPLSPSYADYCSANRLLLLKPWGSIAIPTIRMMDLPGYRIAGWLWVRRLQWRSFTAPACNLSPINPMAPDKLYHPA